jgi:hypothetical protein
MPLLEVQKFLRSGKSLEDLEEAFAIERTIKNNKVSLNYHMIKSPMDQKIVRECRGLILRLGTWDVVAFPFYKFFNLGEGQADPINWETAKYFEKLDGSMIVLYYDTVDERWYTATRGMPEADGSTPGLSVSFAELVQMCFKEMGFEFGEFCSRLNKRFTYIFEMTTPYNRIVVAYNDLQMTLIGVRDLDTFKELYAKPIADQLSVPYPKEYSFPTMEEMQKGINQLDFMKHEGVVAVDFSNFNRVKVKSDDYRRAHGAISSISASDRNLMRMIVIGKDDDLQPIMGDFLRKKTEKFKSRYAEVLVKLQKEYDSIKHIDDMKEFANHASRMTFAAAMFAVKRKNASSIEEFLIKLSENNPGIDRILDLIGQEGAAAFDYLPQEVVAQLPSEVPCVNNFEFLVKLNPDYLIKVIKSNRLDAGDLTHAAEILGKSDDSEKVVPILMHLLDNNVPVVREGAVFGLGKNDHLDSKEVRRKLRIMAKEDKSQAVKTAAKDVLEWYEQC